MMSSLIDHLKHFRGQKTTTKADPALNQTYLSLHQAKRNRSFVEVTVDGDDVVYQSMILALDPEERTILIDELFPTGFVGLAGQGIQLAIRQLGGRKLKFKSAIVEHHEYDGAPLYVLAMPQDVETDQRRSAFRLPISARAGIGSEFIGPDQQPYHGRIRNVSCTGVALELTADALNSANSFHYNDTLEHLHFDFAGINVDCEVAVRSVDEVADNVFVIGAEFLDLPVPEQRLLERSIMRVQRERIRISGEAESRMAMA